MRTSRLEAFSDGVLAIVITIMVLELRVPAFEEGHVATFADLVDAHLVPVLFSYVLSFVFIAIYWNNHHHLMSTADHVSGSIMWANMHLLFWLSLVPFSTGLLGESRGAAAPAALYGLILLMAAVAYFVLSRMIVREGGSRGVLARAVGRDRKGQVSPVLYALGIGAAFVWTPLSYGLYVAVAALWLIPDRRIERIAVPGAKE
ncbi:MAG TPA: TMEM175 family protein [Cellulomonas sp.]|uniref:TMEM175 family protein n=1 Tax=Cellulomonas sp. TaxID=40001 RepID=UPI002E353564|nr:TMEM175 family protein [Cellulomonas sp.]HEX5332538.1 TMEM175 family protein [Cellulomonas sp.]